MKPKGFRSEANVSLPGVDEIGLTECVPASTPKVSINGVQYCAPGRDDSTNAVITTLPGDEMVVDVRRSEGNFVIEHYNNGKMCIIGTIVGIAKEFAQLLIVK